MLATLGVPFKNPVPITNEYTDKIPVPKAQPGQKGWYPGEVTWHFDSASQSWESQGKPVTPKLFTSAYIDGVKGIKDLENEFAGVQPAATIEERFAAIEAAIESGNVNNVRVAWLTFRNEMPFILARFIGIAIRNYLVVWWPMLTTKDKEGNFAWSQISVPSGNGQFNTSTRPTDEVKEMI
jgi:hypothetical protein